MKYFSLKQIPTGIEVKLHEKSFLRVMPQCDQQIGLRGGKANKHKKKEEE